MNTTIVTSHGASAHGKTTRKMGVLAASIVAAGTFAALPASPAAASIPITDYSHTCNVKITLYTGADDFRRSSSVMVELGVAGEATTRSFGWGPASISAWGTATSNAMRIPGGCVQSSLITTAVVRFDGGHGGTFDSYDNWDMVGMKITDAERGFTVFSNFSGACSGKRVRFTGENRAFRSDHGYSTSSGGCWSPVPVNADVRPRA